MTVFVGWLRVFQHSNFGDVGDENGDGDGENGDESEGICEENWPIDKGRIDCVMVFTLNEHRSARSPVAISQYGFTQMMCALVLMLMCWKYYHIIYIVSLMEILGYNHMKLRIKNIDGRQCTRAAKCQQN